VGDRKKEGKRRLSTEMRNSLKFHVSINCKIFSHFNPRTANVNLFLLISLTRKESSIPSPTHSTSEKVGELPVNVSGLLSSLHYAWGVAEKKATRWRVLFNFFASFIHGRRHDESLGQRLKRRGSKRIRKAFEREKKRQRQRNLFQIKRMRRRMRRATIKRKENGIQDDKKFIKEIVFLLTSPSRCAAEKRDSLEEKQARNQAEFERARSEET
jgi:hypothetical protein